MIEESKLIKALEFSWCSQTSSEPQNWSIANPAYGQCAVTSLVVNDYLGGDILWAMVKLKDNKEVSHYFNIVRNIERDYTMVQFPEGTIIPRGQPKTKGFASTRDYILSFEQTKSRYTILKEKVEDFLKRK